MSIDKFTFNKITKDFIEIIEEFVDAKIAENNSSHVEDVVRVIQAREKLEKIVTTIAAGL